MSASTGFIELLVASPTEYTKIAEMTQKTTQTPMITKNTRGTKNMLGVFATKSLAASTMAAPS